MDKIHNSTLKKLGWEYKNWLYPPETSKPKEWSKRFRFCLIGWKEKKMKKKKVKSVGRIKDMGYFKLFGLKETLFSF